VEANVIIDPTDEELDRAVERVMELWPVLYPMLVEAQDFGLDTDDPEVFSGIFRKAWDLRLNNERLSKNI
jgi:hypothetical protein